MKSQLKQVFFLALFGMVSVLFVFFVPWKEKTDSSSQEENKQQDISPKLSSEEPSNPKSITGTLRIALPSKLFQTTSLLSGFFEEFQNNYTIDLQIKSFSSLSALAQATGFDLLLLPYELLTGVQDLRFQENLSPLFIDQVKELIQERKSFLPFAMDPAVMIGAS